MLDFLRTFRADEDGVVAVDWVVLTAAVVGLGMAAQAAIDSGAVKMASDIGNNMDNATIPTTPFDPEAPW